MGVDSDEEKGGDGRGLWVEGPCPICCMKTKKYYHHMSIITK
jgi:hypothetical protein